MSLSGPILLLSLLSSSSSAFPFSTPWNKETSHPFWSNLHTLSSIGDSYAAGLGARQRADFWCSRYEGSYPAVLFKQLAALKAHPVPFDIDYPPVSYPSAALDGEEPSNARGDVESDPGELFLQEEADPDLTHHFHACTGASIADMLTDQLPQIPDNSTDIMTISAGGNDVGLSPLLNACVYQFYHDSSSEKGKEKGETDCEVAIREAKRRVDEDGEDGLYEKLRVLLDAARMKMNVSTASVNSSSSESNGGSGAQSTTSPPWWRFWKRITHHCKHVPPPLNPIIYLTGYSPFFATTSTECNNVTFSLWAQEPQKQYLTLGLRMQLNTLVGAVNLLIEEAAREADYAFHDVDVRFLPWDREVREHRGRFCEAGVMEPEPDRPGLAFYEWGSGDGDGGDRWGEYGEGDLVPLKSFEGEIATWILQTLARHPDWRLAEPVKGLDAYGRKKGDWGAVNKELARKWREGVAGSAGPFGILEDERDGDVDSGSDTDARPADFLSDVIWWLLPDTFKRVFHPRPHTHVVIADLIVQDLHRRETDQKKKFQDQLMWGILMGAGLFVMRVSVWVLIFVGFVMMVRELWGWRGRRGDKGKGKYVAVEGEEEQKDEGMENEREPLLGTNEAARVDTSKGTSYDAIV